MDSFHIHLTAKPDGIAPMAFSFTVHDQASEEAAKATLHAQLSDLVSQLAVADAPKPTAPKASGTKAAAKKPAAKKVAKKA